MKIKMMLLTLVVTVIGVLGSVSSAFACGSIASQEDCPSEFIK